MIYAALMTAGILEFIFALLLALEFFDMEAEKEAAYQEGFEIGQTNPDYFYYSVFNDLDSIKVADVVPVVRCKDCVFCDKLVAPGKGVAFICSQWFGEEVEENHFCSYGKMDEEINDEA